MMNGREEILDRILFIYLQFLMFYTDLILFENKYFKASNWNSFEYLKVGLSITLNLKII